MSGRTILILVALLIGFVSLFNSAYVVQETEQVIITQFGELIDEPVTEAGLHFKLPFIQEVNRIEKRFLPWDGPANEMPDKKKDYLIIDSFARWKISDPKLYFTNLRDERSARSRLNDILGSETRNAVAKHEIMEIVRTDKNRTPVFTEDTNASKDKWDAITIGREDVEQDIFRAAAPKLKKLGIELLDLRFKRINYHESVRSRIYDRMISERNRFAEIWRNEGEAKVKEIEGEKNRELAVIASEAYKTVAEIKGQADADATAIYAEAYNKTPEAAEFYAFLQTLETYKVILDRQSSLIITTESPLFRLLKTLEADPQEPIP